MVLDSDITMRRRNWSVDGAHWQSERIALVRLVTEAGDECRPAGGVLASIALSIRKPVSLPVELNRRYGRLRYEFPRKPPQIT